MLMHLYELLRERAARYPHVIAVGGQLGLVWKTLDSAQLLDLVDRLADELAAEGVGEGDRVVLWVPNHWRTPVYLFALWKLGAIVVPFDREMNPEGGAKILQTVEPRLILAGHGERPAWAEQAEVTEWWEPGSRQVEARLAAWARPDEGLAALMFTSGTTGTPKGCMISQANLCSQVESIAERIPLGPDCRLASLLPLSHLLELTSLLYALSRGAATHYVPSRRGPDILRVLVEQRVTHMVVVPQVLTMMGRTLDEQLEALLPGPVYRGLLTVADRLPFGARRWLFWPLHQKLGGRLRLLLSGGAALPPEIHRLWERFGVRVVQGYGTSECSPVITLGTPDGGTPIGSVGRVIDGVEARLSEQGELLVRGPNVMRGYWEDPARTAEVLRDGWYATGDLATIDAAGNVSIVGRAKDLIVLPSGLLVWPDDVEEVLREHPAIKDAAVLAVPTPAGGATLHAYLLPANPSDRVADLGPIVAACNGRLAQHQRVATASWWIDGPDFPRTTLLKVRRHLLPMPETAQAVKVESVLAADDPVGQAIAGVARVSALLPEQTLMQLGLDSLGLADLALALEEKTGKGVADEDLHLEMTVEQVRAFLAAAPTLEEGAARPERADGGSVDYLRGAVNSLGRLPGRIASDSGFVEHPLWPYTWGRAFRVLGVPIDLVFRYACPSVIIIGRQYLSGLPSSVIFAGTHRSFPDMPLVRYALWRSAARRFAWRLVPAIVGNPNFGSIAGWYGVLAFGLHALRTTGGRDVSLRSLARVAAAGNAILIFPQGTHASVAEELARDPRVLFRPGVGHLAEALDAAVVPFGLAGTEDRVPAYPETWAGPKIAGIPASINRGPVAIAFGAPLRLEPGESPQAFAARLEMVSFALTRQAERALEDRSSRSAVETG